MWMILDSDYKRIGIISNEVPKALPLLSDMKQEQILNGYDTLKCEVPANHEKTSLLDNEGFLLTQGRRGQLQPFRIKRIEEVHGDQQRMAISLETAATSDLITQRIRPTTFEAQNLQQVMSVLLANTGWELGEVEFNGLVTISFDDYPTSLEAIHKTIESFGIEIEFTCDFRNGRVTKKKVNLYEQRGRKTNKIFEYERNLNSVKRYKDTNKLYTAMIGVGPEGMMIGDADYIEPEYQHLTKGDDFVGDPEALQKYGNDGQHIFGLYTDTNVSSPSELFNKTAAALMKHNKPAYTYEVDIALIGDAELGDTIMVKDRTFTPALYLNARVLEKNSSETNPDNGTVLLGEYVLLNVQDLVSIKQMQRTVQVKQDKWTKAKERADAAYDIAEGAKGAAEDAIEAAGDANELIADLSSDNRITPSEKQLTQKEWDVIESEKSNITMQADLFALYSLKIAYIDAYDALDVFLAPLLTNLDVTSDVNGSTFRVKFKEYYEAKTAILTEISNVSKGMIETADGKAEDADDKAEKAIEKTDKIYTHLLFDEGDYVETPEITVDTSGSTTLQMKVRLGDIPPEGMILLSNKTGTYDFIGIAADGTIRAETNTNNDTFNSTSPLELGDSLVLFSVVFESYNYTWYVNDIQIGSGTVTDSFTFSDIGKEIDSLSPTYSYPSGFKGAFHELRIWSTALTDIEIMESIDVNGDEAGLAHLYLFDEQTGEIAYDSITNEEATLVGPRWAGVGSRASDILGVKVANVEKKVTEDGLVTTVTSSFTFQNELNKKANSDELSGLATKDEASKAEKNAKDYADKAIDSIDYSGFATKTELEQTSEEFNFKFSRSGGGNLIRNSVGFAGIDYFQKFGGGIIDTIQNAELEKMGFGSAFYFEKDTDPTELYQHANVKAGEKYTLSWYAKAEDAGVNASVSIYNGDYLDQQLILVTGTPFFEDTDGYQYFSRTFIPSEDRVCIAFGAEDTNATFTGMMLNIGDSPLQWSTATGEVYNAQTTINDNGVRVWGYGKNRYTAMTPEEFAGYARVDGEMKRVFSLNDDVTEMSKARAEKEINMHPIKIVPITSAGLNGWAFVKED